MNARRLRSSLPTLLVLLLGGGGGATAEEPPPRPHVTVRGIYGGVPDVWMEDGRTLAGAGVALPQDALAAATNPASSSPS